MKRFAVKRDLRWILAIVIGICVVLVCVGTLYATEMYSNEVISGYSDLILEEGEAWFPGAVDPDFAENIKPEDLVPPPELVIEEGEEWIPGAIDPLGK